MRLSIVIPVKDDASQLERCLVRLMPQLSSSDEVIVVDNGSVDESAAIARRMGATVIREDVPGIAAASAAGYDKAVGAIVGRLDADSLPAADWVDTVVDYFGTHPKVLGVTGTATFTDGPMWLRRAGARLYLGAYFATVTLALGHLPLFGSNCAFRREAWAVVRHSVHRVDQLVHDDMDLSYHLGPIERIRFLSALTVGISARPLSDGKGALRIRRGFHTILIHWPADFPWIRIGRRLLARLRPAASR
jgi:glycosyltransferase involved in cell wall biosynthesis